jgi:adenylosuccinate lyase
MQQNLESMRGLIYSQPALLALVDAGMDRHEAYKVVQRHAHAALNDGPALLEALESDPVVTERVDREALQALFDPGRQLTEVDAVFRRLGLLPDPTES